MGRPRLTTLKPRIARLPDRFPKPISSGSWRGNKTTGERGYDYRWQKARERHLREHPLCVMCEAAIPSRVALATVVDHKIPHRGDQTLFWDERNWQSLCASHHSGAKQREDNGNARPQIGADGWPTT